MRHLTLFALLFLFPIMLNASDIWVTDLSDDLDSSNGTCNLREAITAANNNMAVDACPSGSSSDTIYFSKSGTINLISALPAITSRLDIVGPGADYLTVDGNGFSRVFYINVSATASFLISNMTITGGDAGTTFGNDGGGIYFRSTSNSATLTVSDAVITDNRAYEGGGIFHNQGDMILKRCTISENTAINAGGGVFSEEYDTDLDIENSTINGNDAAFGGGIFNGKNATILRSTISGNSSEGNGGGIVHFDADASSIMTIRYSTITENVAASDLSGGDGGGVYFNNALSFKIRSTIIAGNFDLDSTPNERPDLSIPSIVPVTSEGFSLIGNNTGASTGFPTGNPNINDDYVGNDLDPIVANLSALNDNGGPTLTHNPSGMAFEIIDQGSCPGEDYDQRGFAGNTTTPIRIRDLGLANSDDGCDIGALELAGTVVPTSLDFKILLDGPYENVIMNTDLNMAGLLPNNQPFNVAPWNYSGSENLTSIPNDMVDWILVDIYKGSPEDTDGLDRVARRAMYLEDNGDLIMPESFSPILAEPGVYYVAFSHRNHLSAMTAAPLPVEWGETVTVDLTNSLSSAYSAGGLALRDRVGKFTLWAGDGDQNQSVTAFDFINVWLPENGGGSAYEEADFNMDGSVTAFDFLEAWLPANGQSSQVPD